MKINASEDLVQHSLTLATSSFLSSWQELELEQDISHPASSVLIKRRTPERKMQRRIDRRLVSCSRLISPAGSSLHFLCSRQRTSRENHTAAVAEFNRESRKKSSCNVETLTMERLLIEYKDELEIYFLVSFAVFFIGVHKFFSWRAIG